MCRILVSKSVYLWSFSTGISIKTPSTNLVIIHENNLFFGFYSPYISHFSLHFPLQSSFHRFFNENSMIEEERRILFSLFFLVVYLTLILGYSNCCLFIKRQNKLIKLTDRYYITRLSPCQLIHSDRSSVHILNKPAKLFNFQTFFEKNIHKIL